MMAALPGRAFSLAIYGLSVLVGVAAFAYPFLLLLHPAGAPPGDLDGGSTGLLTALLVVLCLVAVLVEVQGQAVSARMVAALGVLVAVASVLRFVETAIPGPGGFSPIFVPILLAGYVFGARFGYLMGVLSLLVSALVTGGVGPWLPYQMLVAGWLGASAGWLPHPSRPGLELGMLVSTAFAWGLLYGFLTNLYFWPFFAGDNLMRWQPGSGWQTAASDYAAFYLATSLVWDLFRGLGSGLLVLALGLPAVRAMARFRDRFQFAVEPGRA